MKEILLKEYEPQEAKSTVLSEVFSVKQRKLPLYEMCMFQE